MAELVNGGSLADNVLWFCVGGAIVAGMLALVAFLRPTWKEWMPSAVAFAIGMYITPNWSVARMVGALVQYVVGVFFFFFFFFIFIFIFFLFIFSFFSFVSKHFSSPIFSGRKKTKNPTTNT